MATHSSTLAWKIPWTEKPGRLKSMGSQRVRYDCLPYLAIKLGVVFQKTYADSHDVILTCLKQLE